MRRGKAWGSLVFSNNYTDALMERTESGRFTDDATVEASDLNVKLDMSSKLRKSKFPLNKDFPVFNFFFLPSF